MSACRGMNRQMQAQQKGRDRLFEKCYKTGLGGTNLTSQGVSPHPG